MKQTLIVYGTRRGTTEKTAQVIGEMLVLKFAHAVEMVNVNRIWRYRKRIHTFNNLIIGSSIVRDRWVFLAQWFLKRHDFSNQKVAVFVTAGFTLNKEIELGVPKSEVVKEAIEKYIDKYIDKTNVKPVSKMAFGGMIVRSQREKFNSWRRDDIELWVMELGKLLD